MGVIYDANDGQILKKDVEVIAKEREYINYILEHINNVINAYESIFESGKPYIPNGFSEEEYNKAMAILNQEVHVHDQSKFSKEEFDAYRVKFYPTESEKKKMDEDIDYLNQVKDNFEKAWQHHYKLNNHHTRYYWDESGNIKDMPLSSIMHMICDWSAMSLKFDGKLSCVDWYNKNAEKEKSELSPRSKQIVEEMLRLIFNEEIK